MLIGDPNSGYRSVTQNDRMSFPSVFVLLESFPWFSVSLGGPPFTLPVFKPCYYPQAPPARLTVTSLHVFLACQRPEPSETFSKLPASQRSEREGGVLPSAGHSDMDECQHQQNVSQFYLILTHIPSVHMKSGCCQVQAIQFKKQCCLWFSWRAPP